MATTVVIHCDRCGKLIEVGRTLALIEAGPLRSRWPSLDLCEPCGESFVGWLTQDLATAAASSESSRVAPAPSGPERGVATGP